MHVSEFEIEPPSFQQGCKWSLPQLSPIQAKVLSFGSQLLQHAATGYLAYDAAQVYNNPNRNPEQPLGGSFYGPLAGALGMVTIATGVSLYNRFRKATVIRGFANPISLIAACSCGGVISTGISQSGARTIYDGITDYNNAQNKAYQKALHEQQALIESCKGTLYMNREEFTEPECGICDKSSSTWGKWGIQFWQARYESGIGQEVCFDQLTTELQPLWNDLTSITLNSTQGLWPCFGEVIFASNPDYNSYQFLNGFFDVVTPLSFVVQTLNETCKIIKGSGTKLFFPMHYVCEENVLSTLSQMSCATPALEEFAWNYSMSYFTPASPHPEPYPGQVGQIVEGPMMVTEYTLFIISICSCSGVIGIQQFLRKAKARQRENDPLLS